MNSRTHIPIALAVACATAYAQTAADTRAATYDTPSGTLIVHSGQPAPRSFGTPPPFARLDHRSVGYITSMEADAYPPLANDFIYADSNRDGRISQLEYERWVHSR